jgi:hypothetical protein
MSGQPQSGAWRSKRQVVPSLARALSERAPSSRAMWATSSRAERPCPSPLTPSPLTVGGVLLSRGVLRQAPAMTLERGLVAARVAVSPAFRERILR